MLLHLLRRFIKTPFNPLVNDTKIAINKVRHQIGEIFVPCLLAGHQQFASTHDNHNPSLVVKQGEQPPVFINEASQRETRIFLHILLVQISIAAHS